MSVVIPTYKHRDFVLATLSSVFDQTFTDYEVIVVNDGSPDGTSDLLRPLAAAGRIRYFEQPNGGQASARNRGLAEARGEFVAFLDDDDCWPADKLAWQVPLLGSLPGCVGVAGVFVELHSGSRTDWQIAGERALGPADFVDGAVIRSPGQALFRRSALAELGGFDRRIWGADDWDLCFRLSAVGPIMFVQRTALLYRVHRGNASADYWRMYKNSLRVYRRHRRYDAAYGLARWVWGCPAIAGAYRRHAEAAAEGSRGPRRVLDRLRAGWCGLPDDFWCLVWRARVAGGRARRRLFRGRAD
ncbi:MAG: glycosyltransferase family 2 protein [Fimbriimonadaceae bacterium]